MHCNKERKTTKIYPLSNEAWLPLTIKFYKKTLKPQKIIKTSQNAMLSKKIVILRCILRLFTIS